MNHAILDQAKHAATDSAGALAITVGLIAAVGVGVFALSLVLNLVKMALS